jgi:hypothetical protein
MIKMIIGLLGLYTDGLAPSKIPACGGALAVAAVVVAEVTVVVRWSVTVLVMVAMLRDVSLSGPSKGWTEFLIELHLYKYKYFNEQESREEKR